ncbi:MAG: radical SAM family heme chaperone HemW [bacterium]|nr:radical SAM family heme chaperone HemW [bacterium]
MPVAVYLHLPFCRRLCPYCDFFKKVPRRDDLARICEAILSEVSAVCTRESSWVKGPITSVYFGGGTPSLHSAEQIGALLNGVSIMGDVQQCEVTLEANPGTLTLDSLRALRAAGINRLSLGAQSFSARKLHLLYRDHAASETLDTVRNARAAGFKNLSLDLIFGLPGETMAEWQSDMEQLLACEPDHVSLYNLEYHEATPYGRWLEQGLIEPPAQDFEAELFLLTHETLERAGFEHYEVSNFAREGYRSVHNQVYWEGKPYLGIGPSAHSFDGHARRFANVADLHDYEQRAAAGVSCVDREWKNNESERWEEWISVRLRRKEGISWSACHDEWGGAHARKLWEKAAGLPSHLRVLDEQCFRLTPEGWFVENEVLLASVDAGPSFR